MGYTTELYWDILISHTKMSRDFPRDTRAKNPLSITSKVYVIHVKHMIQNSQFSNEWNWKWDDLFANRFDHFVLFVYNTALFNILQKWERRCIGQFGTFGVCPIFHPTPDHFLSYSLIHFVSIFTRVISWNIG